MVAPNAAGQGRIPGEVVDRVRAAHDIVETIGREIELTKRGASYKGLCPFHEETTPSFDVDPRKGRYKCFGCDAGGDVIEWTMKRRNVGFRDAVVALAEAKGVPLEDDAPRSGGSLRHSSLGAPSRVWTIRDVDGSEVAQHARFETTKPDGTPDKTFLWRSRGGWTLGRPGADAPLYLCETLAARPGEPVVITEGEKAADAVVTRGLLAVGTVTGASSCPSPLALEALRNRDVTLWPDADEPGRKHALAVGRALAGVAASVRVVVDEGADEGDDAADCPLDDDTFRALVAAAVPFPGPLERGPATGDAPPLNGTAHVEAHPTAASSPAVPSEADALRSVATTAAALARGEIPGGLAALRAHVQGLEAALAATEGPPAADADVLALGAKDAAEIAAETPDQLDEFWPGVIVRGCATLLYGHAKAGKSWLMVDYMAEVGRGRPWAGNARIGKPPRFLYATEEGRRTMQPKLARFGVPPGVASILTPDKVPADWAWERFVRAVFDHAAAGGFDVVVFDTFLGLAGLGPKESNDDGAVGVAIRHLISGARRHNVAVVMVHHSRREDGDTFGALAFRREPDILAHLKVVGGDDSHDREVTTKGRLDPIEPTVLRHVEGEDGQPDTFVYAGSRASAKRAAAEERVLALLHASEEWFTQDAAARSGGRKADNITALKQLAATGRIQSREDAKGKTLYAAPGVAPLAPVRQEPVKGGDK